MRGRHLGGSWLVLLGSDRGHTHTRAPAGHSDRPLLHAAATPAQHTCGRTPGGHALAGQQQGAQLLLLLLAALHVLKLLLQLLLHALTLQAGDLLSVRTCVDL